MCISIIHLSLTPLQAFSSLPCSSRSKPSASESETSWPELPVWTTMGTRCSDVVYNVTVRRKVEMTFGSPGSLG